MQHTRHATLCRQQQLPRPRTDRRLRVAATATDAAAPAGPLPNTPVLPFPPASQRLINEDDSSEDECRDDDFFDAEEAMEMAYVFFRFM